MKLNNSADFLAVHIKLGILPAAQQLSMVYYGKKSIVVCLLKGSIAISVFSEGELGEIT